MESRHTHRHKPVSTHALVCPDTTDMNTYRYVCLCVHKCVYPCTETQPSTQTCIHTDTQIYAHILACTDIFMHTDMYLAIQIDTHAHTWLEMKPVTNTKVTRLDEYYQWPPRTLLSPCTCFSGAQQAPWEAVRHEQSSSVLMALCGKSLKSSPGSALIHLWAKDARL